MEPADLIDAATETPKVLTGGSINGHRVELLERSTGGFVITCDGVEQAVYEAGACMLESCIKSYLAFLQSFPGTSRHPEDKK